MTWPQAHALLMLVSQVLKNVTWSEQPAKARSIQAIRYIYSLSDLKGSQPTFINFVLILKAF